ncbi:unnamed protein product [Rhizophagus irregularis]|uniref:Geranylgeranyl transferase type-2 subunit alpha n=1 Tax=Rhizophagus irregularis TaxID=588596 RepID=A0A916E8X0_9GLOM|nr:unnamed protein product [Rhizophagus irregularis]GBC19290.1 RAB-protein geranylgeranyltransferase [Rhizophagus irregularis DAOM 181602=DAOM 197198]CAB4480056.1 unnamed protein product [Rhizophagus irregularis]CAB5114552.1 unnamed protein product [Rhizophagus irregularis]CAB5320639.1 unnamed protein product [Rhizophagus irregularis]
MHGRKRVKPSAEVEKLRKEKEVTKIKEYRNLVESYFQKKDKKEFDNDALALTTKILSQNPDFYSIWNFRRLILLNGLLKECSEEDKQQTLSTELVFLQELFQLNPKSYWIFNHRRWCLETMQNPDWDKELQLVGKFLELDARNFHAWDYRRYVTSKLSCTTETSLTQIEFDFTTTKINQNFSNYSAWHQRSKLLPLLIKEKNLDEQEKKKLIDKEFELVKAAFYTDPDDQSAWLYHWWLVAQGSIISTSQMNEESKESSNSLNQNLSINTSERIELLQREINVVRELLELEPDSKYCLQTLANLLSELKSNVKEDSKKIDDEIVTICDRLIKIDKFRTKRYEDLRSKKFKIERKIGILEIDIKINWPHLSENNDK